MAEPTPKTPEDAGSEASTAESTTAASPAAAEPTPTGTPLPECYSLAFGMNPQKDRAREQLRHSLPSHRHCHSSPTLAFTRTHTPTRRSPVPPAVKIASMDELRARREERLRESLPFWRESLTNGVLDGAIEHKHGRKYDKLRKLWWHGVPPSMRSAVWSRAMPNNLSITEGLHTSLPLPFRRTNVAMTEDTTHPPQSSLRF